MDNPAAEDTDEDASQNVQRPVNAGIDAAYADQSGKYEIGYPPFAVMGVEDRGEGEKRGHVAGGERISGFRDKRSKAECGERARMRVKMAYNFRKDAAGKEYGQAYFRRHKYFPAHTLEAQNVPYAPQNQNVEHGVGKEKADPVQ